VRTNQQVACEVEREAPSGLTFGEAAVGIAARALQQRLAQEPEPDLVIIRLPVDFAPAHAVTDASGAATPQFQIIPGTPPISHMYPRRALEPGVEGDASLICTIQSDLRVECTVLRESRPGMQFRDAAIRVWESLTVSEEDITSGRYQIGDRFYTRVRLIIRTG
jgi:hypothetical protein